MFNIRLAVAVIFSVALSLSVHGQLPDTLTLDFCHERAVEVWPLSIQKNLYEQASDMEMENISKNYLPRFDLNGRATYQSEVTKVEVNMPGVDIPSPDKDMYNLYLGLNQLIWDGGISRNQKILEQADLEISKQQVEVELYQVKSRVNGLFYKILLYRQSRDLLVVNRETVSEKLQELESAIRHGVMLQSDADAMQAQILEIDQKVAEIDSDLAAHYRMLGQMLEMDIPESTELLMPDPEVQTQSFVNLRPEYHLLEMQKNRLELSKELVSASYLPKFSGFGKLGYGKPGLNMLSDKFDTYYYLGVGLQWDILNWNKQKNQKKILDVQQEIIEAQRRAFDKNIDVQVTDDLAEIRKYEQLMEKDQQIIDLRERITKTASSKLDSGTITSSQYLDEVNRETRTRLDLEMHRIQLSLAKIDYLKTIGEL